MEGQDGWGAAPEGRRKAGKQAHGRRGLSFSETHMANVKKAENINCWQECEARVLLNFWREHSSYYSRFRQHSFTGWYRLSFGPVRGTPTSALGLSDTEGSMPRAVSKMGLDSWDMTYPESRVGPVATRLKNISFAAVSPCPSSHGILLAGLQLTEVDSALFQELMGWVWRTWLLPKSSRH